MILFQVEFDFDLAPTEALSSIMAFQRCETIDDFLVQWRSSVTVGSKPRESDSVNGRVVV